MSNPSDYKRSYLNLWDESKTQRFRIHQTDTATTMVLNSNTFALVDGVRSVTETVSELLRIQPIHTQISSLESRTVIQEGRVSSLNTRASLHETSTNSQVSLLKKSEDSMTSLSTRAGVYEANTGSEASKVIRAEDSMASLSTRASIYETDVSSQSSRMDVVLRPGPTIDKTTISGLPVFSPQSWPYGILHPNGKIYGIPRYATSVMIIDPVTNTVDTTTLPTGIASGNNFVGGVLHPNGKIYVAPYTANSNGRVLIIDPSTNTVDTTSIIGLVNIANGPGGTKLSGAVHSNGKIYYPPFINNNRMLIVDPNSPVTNISGVTASTSSFSNSTRTLTCPGANFTTSLSVGDNILISTSSTNYTGYVQYIADNQNVVFIAALGTSLSAGTITSIQKTRRADVTTITNLGVIGNLGTPSLPFGGAVFANGKIYCSPRGGRVAIIDPDSPVTSISGVVNSTSSYDNTTRVLNCPGASFTTSLTIGDNIPISTTTGDYMGIVESIIDNQNVVLMFELGQNLSAGIITSIQKTRRVDVTTITVSNFASFNNGILAPNGKIYMTPSDRIQTILVIDPQTNITSTISINRPEENWAGGVLTPGGIIYVPGTTRILRLDTNTNEMTITAIDYSSGHPVYANNKLYIMPTAANYITIIDITTKSLESLTTRANSYDVIVASQGSRANLALTRNDSLTTRASGLESQTGSLGVRTDSALGSIASLSTRATAYESNLSSLTSRNLTTLNSLTSLSTRATNLENNIASEGSRMATLTTGSVYPPVGMSAYNKPSPYIASTSFNNYNNNIVGTWTRGELTTGVTWSNVCWSPQLSLFCAVANSGNNGINDLIATSSDGLNWTPRVAPANNAWNSVCWSAELGLFCAVASSGTGDRVMTSSDGITWVSQTSAADNAWNSVCWSPQLGLFCAVASSGSGNRVMTSSNGIIWTIRSSPVDNIWNNVCWSAELGLFCAVASSGNNNRVMTSSDGINWITRTSVANQEWNSVAWAPELGIFCAVSGFSLTSMTSSDGINWQGPYNISAIGGFAITYSPQLRAFVSFYPSFRYAYSTDGINWQDRNGTETATWVACCWAPELNTFCAVSNRGPDANTSRRSSQISFRSEPWKVFNINANAPEFSSGPAYNQTTGAYLGSNTTTIASPTSTYSGEWIQIQLASAIVLRRFEIVPSQTSINTFINSPRNFVVLGSNNGSTWIQLFSTTGQLYSNTSAISFTISSPSVAYQYYRMVVNEVGNTNQASSKDRIILKGWLLYDSIVGSMTSLTTRASVYETSVASQGSLAIRALNSITSLSVRASIYETSVASQASLAIRALDSITSLSARASNLETNIASQGSLTIRALDSISSLGNRASIHETSVTSQASLAIRTLDSITSLSARASILETNVASQASLTVRAQDSIISLSTRASNLETNIASQASLTVRAQDSITSLSIRASIYEIDIASQASLALRALDSITSLTTRFGVIENNNYSQASRMTIVETDVSLARDALLAIFDGNPADANYSTLQLVATTINANPESFSVEQIYSRLDYITSVIDRLTDEQE
jgi:hypothetical protein